MLEVFQKVDKDQSGTINFQEYFASRAQDGEVPAELKAKYQKEFNEVDEDGNGELDFEEMTKFYLVQKYKEKNLIKKANKICKKQEEGTSASNPSSLSNMMRQAMLTKLSEEIVAK